MILVYHIIPINTTKDYYSKMDRKITVKKFDDNYFYKATILFPEHQLEKIESSSIEWLENTRKDVFFKKSGDKNFKQNKEHYPPEASSELLSNMNISSDYVWTNYLMTIKAHVLEYCKLTKVNYPKKIASTWVTRVADIDIPGSYDKNQLRSLRENHCMFGNMHSHKDNRIGVIFYLKNPDPKYGTLVRLNNTKIFQNNGEENSLLIFNPELYHTAIYPTEKDLQKSPRITIVTDFI